MEINGVNNLNRAVIENNKKKVADTSFESELKNALEKKDDKQLRKVCQEFEGIFLDMIYKEMKATVPKTGLIPDSAGGQIFESMLDEKLVEEASKGKGVGLADVLYRQLSRQMKSEKNPE